MPQKHKRVCESWSSHMVYGERLMRANVSPFDSLMRGLACFGSRSWPQIIGTAIVTLLMSSSAFADFMVQPITIRKQVHPGRQVQIEFRLENLSADSTEQVFLKLAELTQDRQGIWDDVDPNDPSNTVDVSKLRSCRGWLKYDVASVVVDPLQFVPVTIVANIPAGTRGYYFAALVAETAPRQTEIDGPYGGALVGLQYIVPIILEVQGLPLQHDVRITDVGLEYLPATLDRPTAAVSAWMNIANFGSTYSHLQGMLRVQQEVGGNWRRVGDLKLSPCGIIPGVSLKLTQDVGTMLPSGKYKVDGYLYVDGRRGSAYSNELDFQGDRRIVDPRTLAPIDLDKENLFIDVVPGGSRGGAVMVTNVSENPVTVRMEFVSPAHMCNMISGRQVRGDDLSCAAWANVMPMEFTLQRYARRSVNVNLKVPAAATDYSNYYGTLNFHTTFADGSSAGTRTVDVCVTNTRVPATPLIDKVLFTLSESITPGRYIATATFSNGGVTYCEPRCRGLVTGQGGAKIYQFLMEASDEPGVFLPFEKRTFSGVLDVAEIPVGDYRLTAILVRADAQDQSVADDSQNQVIITVYEEGGQKAAKVAGWDRTPDGQTGRTLIKL